MTSVETTRRPRRLLFGVELDAVRLPEVVELCSTALDSRAPTLIGVLNAAKVVKLRHDTVLRESLLACDVVVADGQSVVWASRILRRPLPERVAGIDLFESLLALANRRSRSVYLLGATPEVLTMLVERVTTTYPNLRIAGRRDGYFTDDQSSGVAAEIRASGADMLFLGMTSPKKEIFLGTYGDTLRVPVLHGVGGSFDVLAWVTRRAPVRWQRLGMEWAYRLVQEPRRLWKRYLTTNLGFLVLVGRELVAPSPAYRAGAPGRTRDDRRQLL